MNEHVRDIKSSKTQDILCEHNLDSITYKTIHSA